MTVQVSPTSIVVLGKTYQLKCPPEDSIGLQKAAQFLEAKMQTVRETTYLLSIDRIAVLAALSISHDLLALQEEKNNMNERLRALQQKLDTTLARCAQMELPSAE
jgi:cell division protein ZapA